MTNHAPSTGATCPNCHHWDDLHYGAGCQADSDAGAGMERGYCACRWTPANPNDARPVPAPSPAPSPESSMMPTPVNLEPGESYYRENGWSGCAGSEWHTLTDATKDGWRHAERLATQLSALLRDKD